MELRKAAKERGIAERYLPREADISSSLKAEGFEIQPSRISGGDLRGVMYGLLEAAEQVRTKGKVSKTKAEPAVALRGIRLELDSTAIGEEWFHSRTFWQEYMATLARARINRLQLEFASPPFPYFLGLPLFDSITVEGLTPYQRGRNFDALKQIAGLAVEFAVDVAIGIRSVKMPASVAGLPPERTAVYLRSALETLLAEVHGIRTIAVPPPGDLAEPIGKAVASVGRFVTVESVGEPFHENWRAIEELGPHQPMPPVASLRGGSTPIVRRVASSRFADPQYARLTAQCVSLGAMGIEVGASHTVVEPENRMTYFVWGRLSYDPSAPDTVWRAHPLDDAMASAARTYSRTSEETELQTVQRLHWNAALIERALHGQQDSPLVDGLRLAANRARYDGRLLWGEFLLASYRSTPHDSFLRAALREFQAAKLLAVKLQLPVEHLDKAITEATEKLPQQTTDVSVLPWAAPATRPSATHRPLQQSEVRKPLVVPLSLPPRPGITKVRLRYRMLESAGEFDAMETTGPSPRFTIPATALNAAGVLLYYFELHHPEGVWLYPDPVIDPPVFQTRIKDVAAKKQP